MRPSRCPSKSAPRTTRSPKRRPKPGAETHPRNPATRPPGVHLGAFLCPPAPVTPRYIFPLTHPGHPGYPGGTVSREEVRKLEKDYMRLYVERWPLELHRQVKAQAAVRGVTFRQVLLDALTDWIKMHKGRR